MPISLESAATFLSGPAKESLRYIRALARPEVLFEAAQESSRRVVCIESVMAFRRIHGTLRQLLSSRRASRRVSGVGTGGAAPRIGFRSGQSTDGMFGSVFPNLLRYLAGPVGSGNRSIHRR